MFAHREVRVGIGAAVTDRFGGVSRPPYDELNLADHVGDDPHAVARNRALVRDALAPGAELVTMRQVHGADVAVVDEPPSTPPAVDALVTRTPGLLLVAQVADCTPILLWDRRAGVVAAVHAGRRGLAAGVLGRAIETMAGLSARPDGMSAVIGPGICPEHYEVSVQLRDEVAAIVPESATTTSRGAPALDIRTGLLAQLAAAGVPQWMVVPHCTAETEHLYSYRRDRTTGRFAGVVWIEP